MQGEFDDLNLADAGDDMVAGYHHIGKDAHKLLSGEDDEEDEDEFFFGDDAGLSTSPLIRALRGDPHPKAHHHGLHERQLVGAWRTLQTPTWVPSRQELAVVHKIHKELGLITIQFSLDQRRMMIPQAFVEPVLNEPPPVQVRYLPRGAPVPTQEEAMRPWHPYWSHAPEQHQGTHIPGMPGGHAEGPHGGHFGSHGPGPFPAAEVERAVPQFPEPERWPVPQNTAQALRNRSIPPQAIQPTYGEHFYSQLYRNNFYRGAVKDDGRHFYVPIQGGAYEQMPNGNLVPVERLADGRIVPKSKRGHEEEDSLFGHFGRHIGMLPA